MCVYHQQADNADNLSDAKGKEKLHGWNAPRLNDAVREMRIALRDPERNCHPKTRIRAIDLVLWLLQPKPQNRPQSFADVLDHSFFAGKNGKSKLSNLHVASALGDHRNIIQLTSARLDLKLTETLADEADAVLADLTRRQTERDLALQLKKSLTHEPMMEEDPRQSRPPAYDVDQQPLLSNHHLLGYTPLHVAAVSLQEDIVEILLCIADTDNEITEEIVAGRKAKQSGSYRIAAKNRSSASKKLASLLNECVNCLDLLHETPLHSILKIVDLLHSHDLEIAVRIISLLVGLTDPSLGDAQGKTVFEIGCASPVKSVREYFVQLRQAQSDVTREHLFRQTVLDHDHGVLLEPWGLGNGSLQAWVRSKLAPDANQSLVDLVDLMGDVDGFTLLSTCVEVTPKGAGNWSKASLMRVLGMNKKQWKGGVAKNLLKIFGTEASGYYKTVLLSYVVPHRVVQTYQKY